MADLGIRYVRSAMLAGISASALLLGSAASAQVAQPADDDAVTGSNDIIVTTRRIEERLQDVPIAVTAITSEEIQRQNIEDLTDIAEKTVGFAFEGFTGALAQPTIRGQTNLRTTSPVQNVATSINGIYLQRGYFIDQGLLDLERVEIIKGPQSALYGRNAFAGVVSLQTRAPDLDELSGRISATIGTDARREFKAGINIPIAPGVFAIYAASGYSTFDGTWRNSHPLANSNSFTTGNLGGYEKRAMQIGAKLKVGPVTAEGMYIRTVRAIESTPTYTMSTIGLSNSFNTLNASPRGTGAFVTGPPGAAGTLQNRLHVGVIPVLPTLAPGEGRLPGLVIDPRSFGLRGPSEIWIGKLTLDTDGPISFQYLYGHTNANIQTRGSSQRDPLLPTRIALPPTFVPVDFGNIFDSSGTDSRFYSNSHELKALFEIGSTINGFIGGNLTKTFDVDAGAVQFAPVNSLAEPAANQLWPVAPGNPVLVPVFGRGSLLQRVENVASLFGFAQWKPTENLAITLEGRYTEEDLRTTDLTARDTRPGGLGTGFVALVAPTSHRNTKFFTPRGSITYKFSDDNNVYLSAARGYKSGGTNGVAASYTRNSTVGGVVVPDLVVPGQPLPAPRAGATAVAFVQTSPGTAGLSSVQEQYQAETNWTYEIGSKNRFFGGALTLNLAAYLTDWSNLQSNAVRLLPDGTQPTAFLAIVPSTTGNVGNVQVYGVEVEGNWRITRELRLDFGASYNRARYKSGTVSQRVGASGNCDGTVCASTTIPGFSFPVVPIGGKQLERTPEFDALLGLNFDTEFSNGWKFYARGDVTYQTKQFVDETNLAFVPDRTLVNASIGMTIDKFNIQVWSKNLLDKQYVSSALFLIGIGGALSSSYVPILGDRRTVGLTVSTSF